MLKVLNYLFLIFLLQVVRITATSQVRSSDLDSLLDQYKNSDPDTNRVRILLQIDTIYIFKMVAKNNVFDSGELMAKQARALSTSLKFQQGYDEATFLLARNFTRKNDMGSAEALMNDAEGGLKIHLLIILAEHYTFLPGELKENLDSAYPYILTALDLSKLINSDYWTNESICILGKYYYARGDFEKGKNCFLQIIQYHHNKHDKKKEAHWWEELAIYMPDTKDTYADEVNAYESALAMYKELDQKDDQRSVLENLAYIHQIHKDLNAAEAEMMEALRLATETGNKRTFRLTQTLAQINLSKGNYNKSLYYSLEAVKSLNISGEYNFAGSIYFILAEAYHALGNSNKSLEWYYKSLDNLVARRDQYLFAICSKIVNVLIETNKNKEALAFLQKFLKQNKPVRFIDKEMAAASMGNCYKALAKYQLAEKYYLQMISLDTLAQEQRIKQMFPDEQQTSITSSDANLLIGKFYVERGAYTSAKPYLSKALTAGVFVPPLTQLRDIHFLLFQVDSAQANYVSAIRHFELSKTLNDSVFNIAKSKQIEELQIKYETDKKDKDLKLLSSNEKLQKKELQRSAQVRNFTYAIAIMLLILTGITYSRYRIKQRANRALESTKDEINHKNEVLQQNVREKNKLLEEKDWLVKEIHHRVKNNLQIVISLLNVQSDYLDNPSALNAIQESRERMQAIALIHQKLYQPNYGTLIKMKSYIEEMVGYLGNFADSKKVFFKLNIEDIRLDVSQAVPLGLILNEAITNSLKYAFSPNQKGIISISLQQNGGNQVTLHVADNGKGFPSNLNFTSNKSLGIQLINLFSEQLEGELQFESKEGAHVKLIFKPNLPGNSTASSSFTNTADEDVIES